MKQITFFVIDPWHACAARDTVIVQSVCWFVCASYSRLVRGYIALYFEQLGKGLMSYRMDFQE